MSYILYPFSLFIVTASILPLLRSQHWMIRAFDFPRMHFGALNLLLLIAWLVVGLENLDYLVFAALLFSLSIDIYRIIPYSKLYRTESKKADPKNIELSTSIDSLKILSVNVRAKNKKYRKLIRLVKENEPNILLLIEATKDWEEALGLLKSKYPFQICIPQNNTYGMLLFSKFPILEKSIKHLVDQEVPSIFCKVQLSEKDQLNLICLHPRPPRPKEGPSTERDGELAKVARYINDNNLQENTIVLGDLNDVAWSHSTRLFLRESKLLDPRIGRGFYNSFPAKLPGFGFPLDHVFHGKAFFLKSFETLRNIGSDHLPYYIEFQIGKNVINVQQSIEHKKQENVRNEINEKIKQAEDWNGPNQKVKAHE